MALVLPIVLAACGGGGGSAGSGGGGPAPGAPVDGPAWRGFAGNSQHTALGAVATQDLNRTSGRRRSTSPIMREVMTIAGPTFESGSSGPVRERCINTAAVDPLTRSVMVNNEDGFLYRWDPTTNRLSQLIRLTAGLGEAYTPTAIGADGAVYAINDATLFSVAK